LLEHGAFVALALLLIWVVALLVPLARGTLKAVPFGAASMFLALMIPFFWLGPEITELTILKVGSFKTNAEQATKYFEEIKTIRAKIETEAQAVNTALTALKADIAEARTETKKIKQRLADRQLTNQQVAEIANKLKPFTGQEFSIVTYWEMREPLAFTNRVYGTLDLAGWKYIKLETATFMLGGIEGVQVWRHPNAEERVQKAADALVAALNDTGVATVLKLQNTDNNPIDNKLTLDVGTKPDFP
jgi:hypothetical protein